MDSDKLQQLAKRIRYEILTATTAAQSGHPTTALSAVELMTTLYFGGFLQYDLDNPQYEFNDRVIFSKGHASALLYSLYAAAGVISHEEMLQYRRFDSVLEGHPTPRFKYIDVATGSLGQGLSAGLGMALGLQYTVKNAELELKRAPNVFVLLGDSEFAEGQIWEALEVAGYYKVNNLIGILDVNRLGQRGETMTGWDMETYKKRIESFGWETIIVDGHNIQEIIHAYKKLLENNIVTKPKMIIAKTVKGKGFSQWEDKNGFHSKQIKPEQLDEWIKELGEFDRNETGTVKKPMKFNSPLSPVVENISLTIPAYDKTKIIGTKEVIGDALVGLVEKNKKIIVLDAELSNSTMTNAVTEKYPDNFIEMFIAEQNMVSVGVGLSALGYVPFISSFASFFTRGFDQIRLAQYSNANLKILGSYAGSSIGMDGPSGMGLEDMAMMRSILKSIVLYPSDVISTFKLMELIYAHQGISYLRITREKTPIIYTEQDTFTIGGSKVLHESNNDKAVIISAGVTVHNALAAYIELKKQGIEVAVIDAYSVKPIDTETIRSHAKKTGKVIVVEDHYPDGGLGDAVAHALIGLPVSFTHLAVAKIPRSGKPSEVMKYEEIDSEAIVKAVI